MMNKHSTFHGEGLFFNVLYIDVCPTKAMVCFGWDLSLIKYKTSQSELRWMLGGDDDGHYWGFGGIAWH